MFPGEAERVGGRNGREKISRYREEKELRNIVLVGDGERVLCF